MSRDVAFGTQVARSEDQQPERVVMVAPDGRTVQVMAGDVAEFAERGFRLVHEPGAKAKRGKAAGVETAEEASA